MILIENLNYAVDKELNVYKNVDILIKKENETGKDRNSEDDGKTKIIIGRNLIEKENLNKKDFNNMINNISSKLNIPATNVITGTNLDEFIEYVRYKLK